MQKIKFKPILLGLVIGLVALGLGQWSFEKLFYFNPLEESLENNSLVQDYSLNTENKEILIEVSCGKLDNIMLAYQDLEEELTDILGNKKFTLKILDKRNLELENIFSQLEFAIYEAKIQGNYRDMEDYILTKGSKMEISPKIFVDEKAIYLQLEKEEAYLYERVVLEEK